MREPRASLRSTFLRVCHLRFGCESRFTGLAVADLVSC
jgi:hypothetical protein